ncbi:MAG: hypothetical protein HWD62_18980 [Cyclobacteriaceae bacterium]|nr:MAG: hypothetical protein HWD62_18980 [Cyclobacteriaceae bacterium]
MMQKLSFIVCSLLVYACTQKSQRFESEIELYEIQSSGNITSELMDGFGEISPEWIEVVADSMLLIVDRNANPAINIYSLKTQEKLYQPAREETDPLNLSPPSLKVLLIH